MNFYDELVASGGATFWGMKAKSNESSFLFPTRKDTFRLGDFEEIVKRVHQSIKVLKRGFPGDKDFHYHVLRHSLHNMLLLKLWPALHPVARRILHRYRETLESISGCEKFQTDLFGTDTIRSNGLQATAQFDLRHVIVL